MIESGSLTPITNFFKKEDNQIEHKKLNGKSSTKLMGKETFEVGSSDYSNQSGQLQEIFKLVFIYVLRLEMDASEVINSDEFLNI